MINASWFRRALTSLRLFSPAHLNPSYTCRRERSPQYHGNLEILRRRVASNDGDRAHRQRRAMGRSSLLLRSGDPVRHGCGRRSDERLLLAGNRETVRRCDAHLVGMQGHELHPDGTVSALDDAPQGPSLLHRRARDIDQRIVRVQDILDKILTGAVARRPAFGGRSLIGVMFLVLNICLWQAHGQMGHPDG